MSRGAAPADDVRWIYRRLLKRFGPRGWWPVTPAGKVSPVYLPAFSRGKLTPEQQFEMAVGAILTQNTAWTNVEKALARLIAAGTLSPEKILKIPAARLETLIRSSGYFRQKAARLKGFARFLAENWRGRLDLFLDRPAAQAREELLALNGIGPETADSILLYAGGHPSFVVDAYTRRLGRRYGLFETEDYHEAQSRFVRGFPPSVYEYREYHALIVELGKHFCRSKPACPGCPLQSRCALGRTFLT